MSARKYDTVRTEERRPSRRELIPVVLILAAAVLFRVVYLWQYRAQIPYFSVPVVDSHVYDAWARMAAAGEGYGPKPFYMAPLYPCLLALVYKIAGHKLLLVYVLQAALGVSSLFLVYILGRRIFDHRSGLIAMLLLMLYAPLVFLESKLLTETLAVTLNLASILLVMRALDRPSAGRFLVAGLALGLSVLCRPAALITAALVCAWLLWARRRQGTRPASVALLVIGLAAAILPVTVRNYVVGGGFALISTNAGIVFAQGNSSSSSGLFASLPGFSASVQTEQEEGIRLAGKALGRRVKASEASSYWLRYGLEFARENPGRYALLLLRKLTWSLHNRESACIYNMYLEKQLVPALRLLVVPFSALVAFGLYGIVLSLRKTDARDARILALMVLSIYLSLIVFSVSSRFRAPVSAPLAVFAGHGLLAFLGLAARRDLRRLAVPAVCISTVFLVSLVPYPKEPIAAEAPTNLGAAYFTAGRTDEAVVQLRNALDMDPGFTYAHLFLGRALSQQERHDEAVEHFEQVIDDQPDNADAHHHLGYALAKLGRSDEAVAHYSEVVRLQPDNADARFNLGVLHDVAGRTAEAVREYRAAIAIRPSYAEARNNLAVLLYFEGAYEEAWREVRLCRKHGGSPNPEFIEALSAKMPEPKGTAGNE